MGLFSKKKDKGVSLPRLPEIPTIPTQFPTQELPGEEDKFHELPTFPTNQMSKEFSQNTIKNAVIGEDDMPTLESPTIEDPEIPPTEEQIIPPKKISPTKIKEFEMDLPKIEKTESTINAIPTKINKDEPIFVRIDHFEEGLEIFENTKSKIEEIEILLKETKELKEKEEEELSLWEKEIQKMKVQIEKVDKDIFSKI